MTMGWIAGSLIGGVGSVIAANTAANASRDAAASTREISENVLKQQQQNQDPYIRGGVASQNKLLELLGIGTPAGVNFGKYARDFSMEDFKTDPGYNFRLSEGLKSLDRQAAARGGLISGGALKAAQDYGQNVASDEYMNAYNRYRQNRSDQLNPLLSLTGAGQTATNQLNSDIGNFGTSVSNSYGMDATAGNTRASGYINSANSIVGGINSYLNYNQQNKLLEQLLK